MSLQQLDNQTVAIELRLASETRILRGTAHYEPGTSGQAGDPGPVLRICVNEDAGEFEIHLQERKWDGQVASGSPYGCAFMLQLSIDSLCQH